MAASLLAVGRGYAQGISVDSASAVQTSTGSVASLTWSHTVTTTGGNVMLVVGFSIQGNRTTSATYNGVSMTAAGTVKASGNKCTTSLFYLASPSTGANNVVASISTGTAPMVAWSISLTGASSTAGAYTSVSPNMSGSTVSLSGISSAVGSYVVDSFWDDLSGTNLTTSATGSGQTQRWTGTDSGTQVRGSGSTTYGSASVTVSYSLSLAGKPAVGAFSINKATTAAVRLSSFEATRDGRGVSLAWNTGFEVDNLGFFLHRNWNGRLVRINSAPIMGSALSAGQGIEMMAGRTYLWSDSFAPPRGSLQYWLEEVDLDGQSRWHGPTVPTSDPSPLTAAITPSRVRAVTARNERQPHLSLAAAERPAATAIKVRVNREGWYRVRQPDMVAAGLDPDIDPRTLQLSRRGADLAAIVNGEEDGHLDPEDSLEFYGTGRNEPWSDVAVYWVRAGASGGQRMRRLDVAKTTTTAGEKSFLYTVEDRTRSTYFGALLNGENENFFGVTVRSSGAEVPLEVSALASSLGGELTVDLQGLSDLPHLVEVSFNGLVLGNVAIEGRVAGRFRTPVPPTALVAGTNRVGLKGTAGDRDVTLVDSVRLSYRRGYQAMDGHLRFTAPARETVSVEGFSGPAVRVLDITDPAAVIEVAGAIEPAAGAYRVILTPPEAGTRTLWAFSTPATPPAAIEGDRTSSWSAAHEGADVLIVSHRDFIDALGPLQTLRESEGWKVAVVDIEDVYDELSYGEKTPYALRQLIETARTRWARVPRFVLLVGDASFDPRNYLGKGDFDFIPSKLVDIEVIETASDDWFVTPAGSHHPDIAIGRLPVRTPVEATRVIDKIVGFGQGRGRERDALLYVDGSEGDFAASMAEVAPLWDREFRLTTLMGPPGKTPIQQLLHQRLDQGPLFVGYIGHGSEDLWAGRVLTSADAATLMNQGRPSVLLPLTCLNGYFQDVYQTGLGKALLLAANGALAVWASSALTTVTSQVALNRQFIEHLAEGTHTIGDAIVKTKAESSYPALARGFILLGDPSTQLPVGTSSASAPDSVPGAPGCNCRVARPPPPGSGLRSLLIVLALAAGACRRNSTGWLVLVSVRPVGSDRSPSAPAPPARRAASRSCACRPSVATRRWRPRHAAGSPGSGGRGCGG